MTLFSPLTAMSFIFSFSEGHPGVEGGCSVHEGAEGALQPRAGAHTAAGKRGDGKRG